MASDVTPAGMPCGRADTEITSASEHKAGISSASEHHREITSTDKQYDVFISHRGPDTKSTFVSHLCKGLEAAGLQPFLDCRSIDMGEKSWECIENAIKRTPIAVVVFSASFAASEWCLRELDVMLSTPGVKVLPVFYNVRPSEVRFPGSGQLRDGFEKLGRRHDEAVMERWRGRLEEASKIMGWEHPGKYKLEAELVSAVVGEIVALANKSLPFAIGDNVISVKQVAEEIMETLAKKKEVSMLGLWGMGGIGKSTLPRVMYNQLSRRYDAACYVEDVTEKVAQGGVVKVQRDIMTDLCKNSSEDIKNKSQGQSILEERLRKKRFLLVLDDVGDNDEMKYLISSNMLTEGSMCIVTSRNRRIFATLVGDERKVHSHDVQGLSIMDSEQVFAFHAFGDHGRVKAGFEELVSSISKACAGVPLVLEVCGALLKKEDDVDVWEEVAAKLNQGTIMYQRIFECLRISFDALPVEQQEMFLDIACALIGERKDLAVRAWKGSSKLGVRSLIERALIRVDEGGCLRMHDHLRDMGREIEKRRRATYGVTRLWMPEALEILVDKKPLSQTLQTLYLRQHDDVNTTKGRLKTTKSRSIHLDVSHLTNLRVLTCIGAVRIVEPLPRRVHWFRYSNEDTLSSFPKIVCKDNELAILEIWNSKFSDSGKTLGELGNLEVLQLDNLTMPGYSFEGLKKLQELKLHRSMIESLPRSFAELRNFNSLPKSFAEMSNLEVLDLDACRGFSKLPDSFGRLMKLRVLKLCNLDMWKLPRSFGELSNLEVLHLDIWNIFTMPLDSSGALKNVRELKLSCSGITQMPPPTFTSFEDMTNFLSFCLSWQWRRGFSEDREELLLYDFGIERFRKSFREMSNLEVLDLSECRDFTRLLLDSFGGLQKVRELKFYDFKIQNLPNSIGELSNLEVLDLSGCSNLTMLPETFKGLKKLQQLLLIYSRIESLPMSFGELSNLEVLDLSWCSKLTMLPDSFGGLKKIRVLKLIHSGIERLPMSFGELSNLEMLDLSWCGKLTKLPDSFVGLKKMQVLWLYCSGIENLPRSFGELSNLEMLNLEQCSNLTMLPDSFRDLKKIRVLHLSNELKKVHELKFPNSEI